MVVKFLDLIFQKKSAFRPMFTGIFVQPKNSILTRFVPSLYNMGRQTVNNRKGVNHDKQVERETFLRTKTNDGDGITPSRTASGLETTGRSSQYLQVAQKLGYRRQICRHKGVSAVLLQVSR